MFIKMNQKGFTLVEILVVITLILIIAGIALPRFAGVSAEGKKAKAAGELKTLQTALEAFLLQPNKAMPENWTDLETWLEGATPRLVGDVGSFKDPFRGSADTYTYAASGNYYVIYSFGPDKTTGITGINNTGDIQGVPGDDIYVTNGQYTAATA